MASGADLPDATQTCPGCGVLGPSYRLTCKNCGTKLFDGSKPARSTNPSGELSPVWGWGCLAIVIMAVIFGALYLNDAIGRAFQPTPLTDQQRAERAQEAAHEKLYGQHCLSRWDGSDTQVVEAAKRLLRDPDSFEHIATTTTPVDSKGQNALIMHYRSRNGFGGMTDGFVSATLDNATCKVTIVNIN